MDKLGNQTLPQFFSLVMLIQNTRHITLKGETRFLLTAEILLSLTQPKLTSEEDFI